MKPDLDDYEELNDEVDAPRGRAMSWVVLGLAVAGFASLAYYAYHSGSGTQGGDVLVVAADQGELKTAPANPGGEEFPNKDKTIYDVIAPEHAGGEKQAEKLLPEPQTPVLENHAGDHEDDDVDAMAADAAKTSVAAPAAAPVAAPAPAAPVAAAPAVPAAATPTTTYVSKNVATASGEDAATPTKAVGEPTFVNEKPASAKKDEPKAEAKKPEPKKEATKSAAKTAEKPASGGSYKVQLGAYASDAEAQAAWKKISSAHSGVLAGGPTIVKAEVNGKTYYRLRAGNFADAGAAKAACAKLGGQACIPVK